eukprot:UN07138
MKFIYEDLYLKQRDCAERCEKFVDDVFYVFNEGALADEIHNFENYDLGEDLTILQEELEVTDEELFADFFNQYPESQDHLYSSGRSQ